MIHIPSAGAQTIHTQLVGEPVRLDYASIQNVAIYWHNEPGAPCVRAELHLGISPDGRTFVDAGKQYAVQIYIQKKEFEEFWEGKGDAQMPSMPSTIHPAEAIAYWIELGLVAFGKFGEGAEVIIEGDTVLRTEDQPKIVMPMPSAEPEPPTQTEPAISTAIKVAEPRFIAEPKDAPATIISSNNHKWEFSAKDSKTDEQVRIDMAALEVAIRHNLETGRQPIGGIANQPARLADGTLGNIAYKRVA